MTVDPFLRVLVAMTEQVGQGVGISLMVHGLVISGDITPVSEYAKWFDKIMAGALGTAEEQAKVVEPSTAAKVLTDEEVEKHIYIHLRNVRIVTPGATQKFAEEMFWRGKLEDVDGFLIGRMEAV